MGFGVCGGCGQVVLSATSCPHCRGTSANFGRAVALLGLTLVAGCPKSNVNSKYGVEAEDTEAETPEEEVTS